jgi:hypothetical protein
MEKNENINNDNDQVEDLLQPEERKVKLNFKIISYIYIII